MTQFDISQLYTRSLPSMRTGLFFNTYSYPTKISPEAIAIYIATHTNPGDTVIDAFSGSGSTGLACLMCEHPTDRMLNTAKDLGVSPIWGPRNAVLYDVSTYGAFAADTMTHAPNAELFKTWANNILVKCSSTVGNAYKTVDLEGNIGEIRHVIWSSYLRCPVCGEQFSFYEGMVSWDPLRISSNGACPHCHCQVQANRQTIVTETIEDALLGSKVTVRKRRPALIYGTTNGKNWKRVANDIDFQDADKNIYAEMKPNRLKKIKWGDLYRAGYHQGISHLHQFYTKRNYSVLCALWDEIEKAPKEVRDALRLWILSYNESHATMMTRVVAKQGSKDFVITGAQSGVLYISNLPVEKNILVGLKRKIKYFSESFIYLNKCSGNVSVYNSSSTKLQVKEGSVQYAFIDPPFGDFIPYSEVNQINELWLDKTTDSKNEAIISKAQDKNVKDYGELMLTVFRNLYKALADDALLTLVFHSSKAEIWNTLSKVVANSGFFILQASYLDKYQPSFKQVVSANSVRKDSLLLLSKNGKETISIIDVEPNGDDKQLAYTKYVNKRLLTGHKISLDASEAYGTFEGENR